MAMKRLVHNKELRVQILKMVYFAKEGHIPSSFSIVDIINFVYSNLINLVEIKKKKYRS